jgi:hypothetical protein
MCSMAAARVGNSSGSSRRLDSASPDRMFSTIWNLSMDSLYQRFVERHADGIARLVSERLQLEVKRRP